MIDQKEMRRAIEAILFMADEPVPVPDLAVLLEAPATTIESELIVLSELYEEQGRGLTLRAVGGGWRLSTHPDAAVYLERFIAESRSARLSQAALETLAIVAYRQPVSRGQIAEIRGVASEGVLRTLIARGVVAEVGRDEGPGQAILYGTTTELLERLGIDRLEDLPGLPGFMPNTEAVERMETGLGPGV